MEDLKDCTFIIPVRLETKERARNLILVLRYISHYFDTNIIICECDSEQRVPQILQVLNLSESVHYLFEEIKANIFHRTRLLNWMTWEARTPLVVNYDVDVLFKPKQYVEAADTIRRGECEFCYPYEGEFYDVPEKTVDEISHTLSVDSVKLEDCKLLNHNSVGGALFMDKSSHIRCGMENEHFVSWGMEDNERAHRWTKLGYRLLRTPGVLYHLEHPRSPDSSERNPGFQANEEECEKVKNMTPDQLVAYVDTWSWPKKNV